MLPSKKQPKKVANVQKNFMYECEICYEDYDNTRHKPMIICSNFHALCLQCVSSNFFKMEYDEKKNPTGRYMCSKCSQIIDKTFVREHHILKEVCNYISMIKQKDQDMRKDFYNYVGSMGMNLVAMREDFDSIQKNNILLKKENQQLMKLNNKLTEDYAKIEKAAGGYEQLKKVMHKVEETKETLQFEKVKLQSINEQLIRINTKVQAKKEQCQKENKRYFQIQTQLNQKKQELKLTIKKNLELIEHNEGAINLKEYLEQEINNLQNQKKKLSQQNIITKTKIELAIKNMQSYWQSLLNNPFQSDNHFQIPHNHHVKQIQEKPFKKPQQKPMLITKKIQEKPSKQSQQKTTLVIKKLQEKKPFNGQNPRIIAQFDQMQKSIKNFHIKNNTVTLTNPRLGSYTHISFAEPFTLTCNQSFTIKITHLASRQIIIGLMTSECKNKKNIYNKVGFYGYDGWSKMWVDGNSFDGKMTIKQGDQVKVTYFVETNSIRWETNTDQTHKFLVGMRNKKLFPVVMMIEDGDQFQVINVE